MLQKVGKFVQTDHRLHSALAVFGALVALHLLGLGQFIKDYQALLGTLITGMFGFYTVNKTMRENAANAQMQLRENAANVQNQKDREINHERVAVRAAIRAELGILHREIINLLSSTTNIEDQKNYVVPLRWENGALSKAYNAVIGKIGLLTDKEIDAVVRAYSEYDGLLTVWRYLEAKQDERIAAKTLDSTKPNEYQSALKGRLKNTAHYVQVGLEALGGTPEPTLVATLNSLKV